ncbi:hypothetical protein CYMTET_49284 [Cymbomonas tetramitiformis]|uniref:Uncharacterized protein n=1 Tax=Cymbomonas tetramitiformis TaxID=36881 RepID=A0AAE0EUP7_9CHLO|nr:hypothetical protein CYMTET_49284 [Cymbomonas tetramitiformis]
MDNEEDNRANDGRVDGGGSAGQGVGLGSVRVGVLRVGTQVEVFWPGERDWFGGRVGERALEEEVTMIEYFDGNPSREEVPGLFTECVMVALRRMRVDAEDVEGYKLGASRRVMAVVGEEQMLRDAVWSVKAGQLEKAVKRLELAKLAPATKETLAKLEQVHPAGTDGMPRARGEMDLIDALGLPVEKADAASAENVMPTPTGFWLRGVSPKMHHWIMT